MASGRRVAVVTGGARGIGAAIARRLVGAGYHVVAGDVTWEDPVTRSGPALDVRDLDVRDSASVERFIADAVAIGELRAVVNCAGLLRATPLADFQDADVSLMWDVNVAGVARVCRAAVGAAAGLEAIVNIGSISGRLGRLPGISLYGATKRGLESMTKALAFELGPRGIRVNALAPGFIEVPMSQGMRAVSGGPDAAVAHIPLGRMGVADEIAEVTEFLLSPRASYVHGAVVVVDGGASAG